MNVIAIINLIGGLVGTLGPMAIDLAAKIKALIEQNNLGSVDIKTVGDVAIAADDATMKSINDWLAAHGLAPLPTV